MPTENAVFNNKIVKSIRI